nr:hypothetical protein CFP56_58791 [Quercus suber]
MSSLIHPKRQGTEVRTVENMACTALRRKNVSFPPGIARSNDALENGDKEDEERSFTFVGAAAVLDECLVSDASSRCVSSMPSFHDETPGSCSTSSYDESNELVLGVSERLQAHSTLSNDEIRVLDIHHAATEADDDMLECSLRRLKLPERTEEENEGFAPWLKQPPMREP